MQPSRSDQEPHVDEGAIQYAAGNPSGSLDDHEQLFIEADLAGKHRNVCWAPLSMSPSPDTSKHTKRLNLPSTETILFGRTDGEKMGK